MRGRIVETVVSGVFAGLYFGLFAQPLSFWTVDRLTTALSLGIGPALAVVWIGAEVVFFLVPFVVIGVWASRSKRDGLLPALAALAVFWLPVLVSAMSALAFGVPGPGFGGIGGAVVTWLALAADIAASAIGLVLVFFVGRRGWTPRQTIAAH